MDITQATELTKQIEDATTALNTSVDADARTKEKATYLHDFDAPDGKWKFAPKEERQRAERDIITDQDRRAGYAQYAVGRLVVDNEPIIERAVAEAMEPLDAVTAWSKARGKGGSYNLEEELSVLHLEEARIHRFDRHYGQAPPSRVLAAYDHALDTNDDALQRWVEMRHGTQWTGITPEGHDHREATAAQKLRRRITVTRKARVPVELVAAQKAIADAKRTMDRVRDAFNIIPINPEHDRTKR
jgi:hypothetical protein